MHYSQKLFTSVCLIIASVGVDLGRAESGPEPDHSAKSSGESFVAATHRASPEAGEGSVDSAPPIEFFQAIEQGTIEVKFIPKNSTQANVIIKNLTGQTVNVIPPATFGAVHVLGQFGGMGMGMGGMGGMGMGGMGGMGMGGMGMGGMGMGGMGMGQGMGGGMGMGGMGMGGMGMGGMGMGGMGMGGMGMGGMMRIPPDKTTKWTVPCVCLEHGKPDPNPRMTYRMVPLEMVNTDPRIAQLCELLGQGKIPQNTAQAVAWHFTDGLSWDELAAKNRVESRYTGNIRYFAPAELQAALRWTHHISTQLQERGQEGHSSSRAYRPEAAVQP